MRSSRNLTTLALLLAVVLLGGLFRFYKIDERGLDGSDSVFYTSIAKAWSEGDRIYQVADHLFIYRPVVYFLHGVGISLLGFTDTSIKLVNATADVISIALIFVIGLRLSQKDPWPAFAAALIYACSPIAIEMSRVELTHTLSTLLVLLAMLFFMFHYAVSGIWRSRVHLGLAGIFTGAAVLTHEELILTAPGYAFFLLAVLLRSQKKRVDVFSFIINILIFSGSLLIICYNTISVHMHYVLVKAAVLDKAVPRGESTISAPALFQEVFSYLEKCARFLWDAVIWFGSAPTLFLFLPLLGLLTVSGVLAFSKARRWRFPPLLFLPAIVLVFYVAGFAKLLHFFVPRLLLPLFPLLVLTVVAWCSHLLARWQAPPVLRSGFVVGLALLLAVFNLGNYENTRLYYVTTFAKSWASVSVALKASPISGYKRLSAGSFSKSRARLVYDELEGKVQETSRILVIGSRFFPLPGRRPLQIDYYFGDNAIDLIDHTEPLDGLISKYQIKYVLFTTSRGPERWIGRKTYTRYAYDGRWIVGEPLKLGASYGFEPGEYTVQKEWEYLMAYLEDRGANLLFAKDWRGEAFEDPPRWKPGYLLYELSTRSPDLF
jgi:4-amino-4-deoxy-L-arabinose transferase-like glycosyltransferase